LREVAQHIVQNNHPQLADGDDLGVTIFVTPGPYPGMWNDLPARPTVCVHSQPLLFASWAEKYMSGQRLIISGTRQVSPLNWPMELKCRSRIHYYLADREAKKQDPESRALLLDLDGFVCEASSANIFLYSTSEGLLAPLASKTLPGVSLATIHDLAAQLRIRFQERNVLPEELFSADEVMLCSTSPCVLPVTRIDGRWVGSGVPGPMFQRLLSAWSELVHLDIASQARQFAQRTGPGMTSEQEA
jgi:branched-subunit amino acid aminotransferase/4-amino-4-deoxychorismate lyase